MKVIEKEDMKKLTKIKFTLPERESEKRMGNIEFIPLNNTCSMLELSTDIIGFKKIDEMEISTGYDILPPQNSTIRITGDLFNAFDMMSDRGLIDPEVIQSLRDDAEFNHCMELTKGVKLEDDLQLQTKQTPQLFKPRLPTLVDDLLSELQSLPKQESMECVLLIISRSGFSLSELAKLQSIETHQPSTPGMTMGDS